MSKQILIKNLKTTKEFLLAEDGARNILAMHPDKFERVTTDKPKAVSVPKEDESEKVDVDIKKTRKRKSSK